MLIGQFLGTSDAGGIPAPFCRCEACCEARAEGVPSSRLRSAFRLTDKIMLDMGADSVIQARIFGDMTDVEHVFFSHTHDDHLNVHMLMEAFWSRNERKTLNCYFTDKAYDIVDIWRENKWILKGKVREYEERGIVRFHKLEYGKSFETDGVTITPFKGFHIGNVGENSALYLITLPDGRSLFYGLDSGPYLEETLDALKKYHIDIFISEASDGTTREPQPRQHMCIEDVYTLSKKLTEQGTLDENSVLYLSHISHRTSHKKMETAVKEMKFPVATVVAFDGLKIL